MKELTPEQKNLMVAEMHYNDEVSFDTWAATFSSRFNVAITAKECSDLLVDTILGAI